ncbi:hypothetical protein P8452_14310 [Trifolium repens]|nr:hypothetical protein P8452_14308 [Trifolium repens]WJX25250.1 hypothetical protein P8452_14310 [Trifolium repens]
MVAKQNHLDRLLQVSLPPAYFLKNPNNPFSFPTKTHSLLLCEYSIRFDSIRFNLSLLVVIEQSSGKNGN